MHPQVRTMSSREFNQATGTAKVAALTGPVFVTDRGRPSHVLLSYEQYLRLSDTPRSLADALGGTPGAGDVDLEMPERRSVARPAALD